MSVILTTERLTLRKPEERDFEALVAFAATERSRWVGGPATREETRENFEAGLAQWRDEGTSYFHIEERATGRVLGRAGIRMASGRPEPELTYSLYDVAYEGQGFAREAAIAVRDWGFATLGLASLVSYIDPKNTPSVALAEALGATRDDAAPRWDKHPHGLVYRHPKPESST